MTTIGYATLQIIPSLEGVSQSIEKQLGGMKGMGKSLGRSLAQDIAQGVDVAARSVEQSTSRITAAREKEADAAGKLRIAEEKLKEVQESGKGGSALARAEEAREAALRKQAGALRNVEAETRSLERAQKSLDDAQQAAARGPSGSGNTSWLDNIKSKAGEASEALKGIGDSSLGGLASDGAQMGGEFLSGFAGPIASIGTKAGPIGLALTAAAGLGMLGGKLLADNVFAGMDQQQSQANVQAKLGVDDATMGRIAKAAADSYAGNFGQSVNDNMDTARAAIQSGLLDAGAGAGEQSALINQLDTVSSILGEDIPAVTRAAQQAIRTGLAGDATQAFDLITKGQQAGLNVSEDWLDTINEYGTQFRKLGLDGPEAVGLLSQAVKGGARDTDVAADALKEFSIRSIDGSKATMGAFHTLGLEFDKTTDTLAAGGPAARETFGIILDRVRQIPDAYTKAQVQVALFGTQSEDLGDALNQMDLSSAVQQIGAVEGATQRAADTAGGTAASSWESMKRTVEVAVDGIQQKLAAGFGPYVAEFANMVTEHQPEIIGFFSAIGDAAIAGAEVTIKSLGLLAQGFGQLIAPIGDVLGAGADFQAWQEELAGNGDRARELREEAQGYYGMGEGLYQFGEKAKNFSAEGLRQSLRDTAEQAKTAAEFTRQLGGDITLLPDEKTIVLNAPTSAVLAGIDKTKFAIEAIPGTKDFRVVPKTEEATAQVNSWISEQTGKPITPTVRPKLAFENIDASIGNYFANLQPTIKPKIDYSGGGGSFGPTPPAAPAPAGPWSGQPRRARGGRISGPGGRTSDIIPIWASDEEHMWTADEVDAVGGHGNMYALRAAALNGAFGKFATGGAINPDVAAAQSLVGTAYSQGNRTDCSGMAARVIARTLGMPESNLMSTKNAAQWLAAAGFQPGTGGPGQISVGWYDHGPNPNDGHMAMTLSDGTNAEAGGKNSVFTLGAGASGANDPKFDQHMFLPTMFGEGQGGNFSGFSSSATSGGGAGTPGVGPNGESGTYSAPDGKSVREADQKVADADQRVKESEAKQRELAADAKDSQRIAAQADVDKAKREAADARADLDEVKKGKFTPGSPSGSGSGGTPLGLKLPSAFSGLASIGLDGMGFSTQASPNSPVRTLEFGNALGSAVGGQVSSLLGVAGVGDAPPFLKAASALVGGISIGGGSTDPFAAKPSGTATLLPEDAHGTRAGQEPGPTGDVWNISTAKVEDAFLEAQRIKDKRMATKVSHL